MMSPLPLSVAQAATALQRSRARVRLLLQQGRIPGVKAGTDWVVWSPPTVLPPPQRKPAGTGDQSLPAPGLPPQ